MPHIFGQLISAQAENSAGNPAAGGTPMGRFYIDTTNPSLAIFKYYNGSQYIPLAGQYFGTALMTLNTTSLVTFNINGNNETVYNTSSSTIASMAIHLPTTTSVGQILRYITNGAVSSVLVSGTVVIGSAVTSLAAKTMTAWQAVDTAGTFLKMDQADI